ncbi:ATP-binding protein [Kitasatospora sp. NPDC001574]
MSASVSFSTPVSGAAVGPFRKRITRELSLLAKVPLTDEEAFEVGVCTSEIFANAFKHGYGEVEDPDTLMPAGVCVDHDTGRARVWLLDPGRARPRLKQPGEDATSGRGLQLVAAYADRFGWEIVEHHGRAMQQVWFEVVLSAITQVGQATAAIDAPEEQPDPLHDLTRRAEVRRRIQVLDAIRGARNARPRIRVGSLPPALLRFERAGERGRVKAAA